MADPRPPASPRGPHARSRARIADAIGALFLVALVAAALPLPRGDRSTFVLLVLGSGAAIVGGRLAWRLAPVAGCFAVAISGCLFAASTWGHLNRSFAVAAGGAILQSAIACFISTTRLRRPVSTVVASVGAGLALLAAGWMGLAGWSVAALAIALPTLVRPKLAPAAIVVIALGWIVVAGGAIGVAAGDASTDRNDVWEQVIGRHRLELWRAAWTLMREASDEVGPGRFDNVPPRYLPEGHVRWAHNDFLQLGAEMGWPSFALALGVFLWAFVRLLVGRRPDAVSALAAASVGALGIQATVEPVLHFAAVPVLAAAVFGLATAGRRSR